MLQPPTIWAPRPHGSKHMLNQHYTMYLITHAAVDLRNRRTFFCALPAFLRRADSIYYLGFVLKQQVLVQQYSHCAYIEGLVQFLTA